MKISVIVPGRRCAAHLENLAEGLRAQTRQPDEVIFVDDFSSDDTPERAVRLGFRVILQPAWEGPGRARNRGVEECQGEAIAFIDADCRPDPAWLEKIEKALISSPDEVIMGCTRIPRAGFRADAISDLGFPAGANLGFEKVWRVDKKGYTDHISSCNFALQRELFLRAGGFDPRLTGAGCEDTELSWRWSRAGIPIRYHPDILVRHVARKELIGFARWHFARGRTNFHFKRIVGSVDSFIRLRLWYAANVVRTFKWDPRLPFLLLLLGISFGAQQWGYWAEKRRWRRESGAPGVKSS